MDDTRIPTINLKPFSKWNELTIELKTFAKRDALDNALTDNRAMGKWVWITPESQQSAWNRSRNELKLEAKTIFFSNTDDLRGRVIAVEKRIADSWLCIREQTNQQSTWERSRNEMNLAPPLLIIMHWLSEDTSRQQAVYRRTDKSTNQLENNSDLKWVDDDMNRVESKLKKEVGRNVAGNQLRNGK